MFSIRLAFLSFDYNAYFLFFYFDQHYVYRLRWFILYHYSMFLLSVCALVYVFFPPYSIISSIKLEYILFYLIFFSKFCFIYNLSLILYSLLLPHVPHSLTTYSIFLL